jgi:hypothetical protein
MPTSKVRLRSGINTQLTKTQNDAGYSAGNLMRARDGLMECVGGWLGFTTPTALLTGRINELHAWANLAGAPLLAAGCDRAIVYNSGVGYDVTPEISQTVSANCLTTTAGSTSVGIIGGFAPGSYVAITTTTSVGGLSLNGIYPVVDTFQSLFDAGAAATSTSTGGGGTITVSVLLGPAPQLKVSSFWSFDNWGQDLILALRGGGIYVWQDSLGTGTRAAAIGGDQPLATNGILVAMPERHLISFGSAPPSSSTIDPMLVAFSDTENYTVWTATAYNAAGTFRLAAGSRIICWKRAAAQILIWTDINLVGMAYVGVPYIYGFTELAAGCGILSPKAAATVGNVAFWMSAFSFWSYNGVAEPIPCTVRDLVFGNLAANAQYLVTAALNAQFNEVTWYYPSASGAGTENDSYVTFNYVDGTWVCGSLARTAWIDNNVLGAPIAAAPGPLIYQHETSKTADGAAIANSLTTGFFDIGDGEDFSFLDQIIMDFADQVGTVLVTIFSQQYPNGPTTTVGPFSVSPTSPFISPRIRGRQIALQFQSSGIGTFWRLGALRTRIAPDGRN